MVRSSEFTKRVDVIPLCFPLCQLTVCEMQAASISYGKETTAVALGDDEDDDEGGGEVGLESRTEYSELKKPVVIPGQARAVSMDVQQDEDDTGATAASGEFRLGLTKLDSLF